MKSNIEEKLKQSVHKETWLYGSSWVSISTPGYVPNGDKYICPLKDTRENVCHGFIHLTPQKMETCKDISTMNWR